nr:non-canonical purine NTP pyrophosphatase [Lacticaseibacillus paracasei]
MHAKHVNIRLRQTTLWIQCLKQRVKRLSLPAKIKERLKNFKTMFEPAGITVKSLADFPSVPTVDETGTTFEENARQKADQYAKDLQLP